MKTILVTGGAGFIGSCFVRITVSNGDTRVINLDKLTYAGNLDSLEAVFAHPNHIFVEGDINDRELLQRLFQEYQPTSVVNFAAESHVDRSIDSPDEFVETNVLAACRLLEASRNYWRSLSAAEGDAFRFLHVSTDEVYGSLGETGRFTEETPVAPNSPYSASKAASDHFVRAFHHTYGFPTVTTNCSNNYGPCQFPEKLIPLVILNAIAGKPLPVYGDGKNVRDWLYVEDHCHAIQAVLAGGRVGETYNIGGNSERSNIQVVEAICALVDDLGNFSHGPCSDLIKFVTDRPGHDRRYAIDASKIQNELGWEPEHDFEDGLSRTVQWYLGNTGWVDRVRTGSYQQERLGLAEAT